MRFGKERVMSISCQKRFVFFLLLWLVTSRYAVAAVSVPAPTAKEKCPVCGMFVAKYPDWVSAIGFKDSTYVYFDGPKDLYSYYINLAKYDPTKTPASVSFIQVKDYYSLKAIDGRKAFYVLGSDVYGPMGKELVPFEKMKDAQEFMNDHKGKKLLRFNDISQSTLKLLE